MKKTWRFYKTTRSNNLGVEMHYVCCEGSVYVGQYSFRRDGTITAHCKAKNMSITDIVNEIEARKYILTGEQPLCKPPVVVKPVPTAEIIHQPKLPLKSNDDDDEAYYNLMIRGY